ncbi:MAG: carboxypeptidase-like regulatory domain-containing protein, partial [Chloroflexi bacterium]|nr:carboxypeptidase-like regulatory domain-containing protein [Chloroflexota bacterium]
LTGSKVTGRVIDTNTGSAIRGATVQISGSYENGQAFKLNQTTADTGTFEFILDGKAQAELTAQKSGYETRSMTINISEKQIQVGDISLMQGN